MTSSHQHTRGASAHGKVHESADLLAARAKRARVTSKPRHDTSELVGAAKSVQRIRIGRNLKSARIRVKVRGCHAAGRAERSTGI